VQRIWQHVRAAALTAIDGARADVTNCGSHTVSVINSVTATVKGFIPLHVVFSPDGTKACVANTGSVSVSVIDIATNTVAAKVKVGLGPIDVGLTEGAQAYVANKGSRLRL
jgi:YVTN family beta-propeller protein